MEWHNWGMLFQFCAASAMAVFCLLYYLQSCKDLWIYVVITEHCGTLSSILHNVRLYTLDCQLRFCVEFT